MLGQQLVTAMASKQLFAHQLLQTLHLLAHRRLRSADGGRRGSKGVEIGDCYEGSQQIEIEIEYRTICTSHIFSSLISFKNNYHGVTSVDQMSDGDKAKNDVSRQETTALNCKMKSCYSLYC